MMQRAASADERTVQKVARGEVALPRRRRQGRARQPRRVDEMRVDPRVWQAAKRLSRERRIILVESPTSVLVLNRTRNSREPLVQRARPVRG
jgi:hypothetical protein